MIAVMKLQLPVFRALKRSKGHTFSFNDRGSKTAVVQKLNKLGTSGFGFLKGF